MSYVYYISSFLSFISGLLNALRYKAESIPLVGSAIADLIKKIRSYVDDIVDYLDWFDVLIDELTDIAYDYAYTIMQYADQISDFFAHYASELKELVVSYVSELKSFVNDQLQYVLDFVQNYYSRLVFLLDTYEDKISEFFEQGISQLYKRIADIESYMIEKIESKLNLIETVFWDEIYDLRELIDEEIGEVGERIDHVHDNVLSFIYLHADEVVTKVLDSIEW